MEKDKGAQLRHPSLDNSLRVNPFDRIEALAESIANTPEGEINIIVRTRLKELSEKLNGHENPVGLREAISQNILGRENGNEFYRKLVMFTSSSSSAVDTRMAGLELISTIVAAVKDKEVDKVKETFESRVKQLEHSQSILDSKNLNDDLLRLLQLTVHN